MFKYKIGYEWWCYYFYILYTGFAWSDKGFCCHFFGIPVFEKMTRLYDIFMHRKNCIRIFGILVYYTKIKKQ